MEYPEALKDAILFLAGLVLDTAELTRFLLFLSQIHGFLIRFYVDGAVFGS